MKITWIIVAVLALMWLGFLHFENNQIRLELDGMKNKHFDNQGVDQYNMQNVDQYNDDVNPRLNHEEDNHPLNPVPNTTDGVRNDARNAKDRIEDGVDEKRINNRLPVERDDKTTSMVMPEAQEAFLNTTPQAFYDGQKAVIAYKSLD